MNRFLTCLAGLSLASCSTIQFLETPQKRLSNDELRALLVGQVVVLEQGARLSYSADGIYEWKSATEHDRGIYSIGNSQVCVKFEDGNSRCDHYEKWEDRYVVVDRNNEVGAVARIEAMDITMQPAVQ